MNKLISKKYDLAIIGAGVVGCAIARQAAKYELNTILIDAASDVGEGTSKANTAILHTGFDMVPGSLESKLVCAGYKLLYQYATDHNIAVEKLGGLLVAWSDEQLQALPKILEKSIANGYTECEIITKERLYQLEPNLGEGALGALSVPGEWIIDPWTPIISYATQAKLAGVEIALNTKVVDIKNTDDGFDLSVTKTNFNDGLASTQSICAKYLINSAGLFADELDNLLGIDEFKVTPRRGELIVFDKLARSLINHVILPVPSSMGKGVLISPTVFGNIMLGPTAENLADKTATSSTNQGLATLLEKGKKIAPKLLSEEITATYAGLRSATEKSDYQIKLHPNNYLTVGGIRSTGLTASLAIAEYVFELLKDSGMNLGAEKKLPDIKMNNLGEATLRPYQDEEKIVKNSNYGRIICHCEKTTYQEVVDALSSPIAPTTLGGLGRRCRAGIGRCAGFYCHASLRKLLEK